MRILKPLPLLASILSFGPVACDDGPDKPTTTTTTGDDTTGTTGGDTTGGDTTGDPPSYWAVGEEGMTPRVGADHQPSQYPLELDVDLRAIACRGAEQAVVAGAGGPVLTTIDGGQQWTRQRTSRTRPSCGPWRCRRVRSDISRGIVLRSQDDARSWTALPIAAHDWTAVSTTATGATVLLASAAGELFRLRDDELTRVYAGTGVPLRGVAITPDGAGAVAVGDAGRLLRSDDGGEQWTPEVLSTARDLQAVRISGDASLIVAVGAAGTIVRFGRDDVAVSELLSPGAVAAGAAPRSIRARSCGW